MMQGTFEQFVCSQLQGEVYILDDSLRILKAYQEGEECLPDVQNFLSLITPEDQDVVRKLLDSEASHDTRQIRTLRILESNSSQAVQLSAQMGEQAKTGDVRWYVYLKHFCEDSEAECKDLKRIFHSNPARIWYKDDKNTMVRINKSAAQSMGGSVEDFEGKSTKELFPEMAEKYLADDLHVLERGEILGGILEEYTPIDGTPGWCTTIKIPFTESRHVLVVSHDVTDQVLLQEHLKQRHQILDRHSKILEKLSAIAVSSDLSYYQQIEEILSEVCQFLDLELGILSCIEGDSYIIEAAHHETVEAPEAGTRFDLGDTYCVVTYEREDICSTEHARDSEWSGHPCYTLFSLESYIGTVVWVEGKKHGTLNFSSSSPRSSSFTEEELSIVHLSASLVSALFEKHASRKEVHAERSLLKLVLNTVPALIGYYNQDRSYRVVNQHYLDWFDISGEVKTGMLPEHPHEIEIYKNLMAETQQALSGEVVYKELQLPSLNGQLVWHSIHFVPHVHNDQVEGFLVVAFDIQQQKDTEVELQRSNEELYRFASIVSHDLKAPLRTIGTFTDWIHEDVGEQLTEKSQFYFEKVSSRIQHMETLISSLLEYSKVGSIDYVNEQIVFRSLVKDVIDLCVDETRFTIRIEDELPEFIGKKTPLMLIVRNLVSNAIKHHDRDGGTLIIGSREHQGCVVIDVIDDGPGINKEFHEKIFQIFQSCSLKTRGTGMGLALVKKTVESIDGRVTVESTGERGSRFTIELKKNI